ncbi:hypothetical protein, partial [Vibrio aestuarianus]
TIEARNIILIIRNLLLSLNSNIMMLTTLGGFVKKPCVRDRALKHYMKNALMIVVSNWNSAVNKSIMFTSLAGSIYKP